MRIKQEELSVKGYLIGAMRLVSIGCLGIMSYASKEAYLVLKDLNKNVIELNVNFKNVNKTVEVNTKDIRSNTTLIHEIDKRLTVEERK